MDHSIMGMGMEIWMMGVVDVVEMIGTMRMDIRGMMGVVGLVVVELGRVIMDDDTDIGIEMMDVADVALLCFVSGVSYGFSGFSVGSPTSLLTICIYIPASDQFIHQS